MLDDFAIKMGGGNLIFHLGDAGDHAHQAANATKPLDLAQLIAQIIEVEGAFPHLLRGAQGLGLIDVLDGLFNEGDNVAHAENAIGDAGGVELLERIHFLAGADELDRLAGNSAHRERGAATAIAVDAGENNTGEADAIFKGAGGVDGVLTGEGISNEQNLMRIDGGLDLGHFDHQGFVERRATGRVEHDNIEAAQTAGLHGAAGDLDRRLAGDNRQNIDRELFAEAGKLFHRCGAPGIERGHQHFALHLLGEALGDFRGRRGFARTLQTDHQDRDGGDRFEINGRSVRAERVDKNVIDDLDHHLAGSNGFDNFGTDGAGAHLVGERADDIERNVRLDQGTTDLAQRSIDIRLGQRAAARERGEDTGELFGKTLEHDRPALAGVNCPL